MLEPTWTSKLQELLCSECKRQCQSPDDYYNTVEECAAKKIRKLQETLQAKSVEICHGGSK